MNFSLLSVNKRRFGRTCRQCFGKEADARFSPKQRELLSRISLEANQALADQREIWATVTPPDTTISTHVSRILNCNRLLDQKLIDIDKERGPPPSRLLPQCVAHCRVLSPMGVTTPPQLVLPQMVPTTRTSLAGASRISSSCRSPGTFRALFTHSELRRALSLIASIWQLDLMDCLTHFSW